MTDLEWCTKITNVLDELSKRHNAAKANCANFRAKVLKETIDLVDSLLPTD